MTPTDTPDPVARIENLRVGEIMIPLERYPTVRPDCTLREAMAELERSQIEVEGRKSLPRVLLIVDAKGRLVGYARRRDIMRGLVPQALVSEPDYDRKKLFDVGVDPNLSELSYDSIAHAARERARRPVIDVTVSLQASLEIDDHFVKAVCEMVSENLSLLPVLKDGRVVGVIRSVELFRELSRLVV